MTLDVAEAFFFQVRPVENSPAETGIVVLSDRPDLCTLFQNAISPKDTTHFIMSMVVRTDDGNGPMETGVFEAYDAAPEPGPTLPPGTYVRATLLHNGTECPDNSYVNTIPGSDGWAVGGAVQLNSFDPQVGGGSQGSFEFSFRSGEHVTGSFAAAYCELDSMPFFQSCE